MHLIDKQPVGTNLGRHIPLHITAVHWFESRRDPHEITEKTRDTLSILGSVSVEAVAEDLFGPNNDIPVMRLSRHPGLVNLHVALVGAMEELGATFDERWTGESKWQPHVTNTEYSRLYLGNEVAITDIDIITRSHKDGDRIILHRFQLDS